ncbi:MAG: group2 RNA polymerase sigma factor [uncultured marine phage]|uniref:Group2 RNA polymerase sigma factor n=1 Tax=uncultured marine phage TaxID=707152 RepID=A0A8D9FSL7_9VIRU|nr:MAG: group2 RNA polymerase sigma factor [uncultured marine phage]
MSMKRFTIQERITTRDCESLDLYLKELNRSDFDPIDIEEEVKLAKKSKEGDEVAIQKMAQANLRFAVSVAKAYQGNGLSLSDLINEANIGLIKAVPKFDETKGFKFISYAVWWIRQTILQAIAEKGKIIRLPLNQMSNMTKINKALSTLEHELGRTPTTAEISERLAITYGDVSLLREHSMKTKSLSDPINDEESSTMEDVISNDNDKGTDNSLMVDSLRTEINRALDTFSERDREIIKLSFGIGLPYPMDDKEISEKYGLTRERIRQIKKNVARELKTNDTLRSFLG